jgi:SAM-dependent methyltransferase
VDIRDYNRRAWNRQVEASNVWTRPVSHEIIEAARRGDWSVLLTPSRPVPREWFPDLTGLEVLCLASGGGQQGPVLAAAGARVTVFDNSPRQLQQDRRVAEREGLPISTIEGDMRDLGVFAPSSFELIFHPVSNCFVPDVLPVWREAFRVLQPGGKLLAGFANPSNYLFDIEEAERTGELRVRYRLPYADTRDLDEEARRRYEREGLPFEFSHTLEEQIGGQCEAGFIVTGLYEDRETDDPAFPLWRFTSTYIATRARKPGPEAAWSR